jgi:hypothetical protein
MAAVCSVRRGRSSRVLVGAVAALGWTASDAGAAAPPQLAAFPSVSEVEAKVTGSDPVDTAARQTAAFRQLVAVVRTLSAGGAYGSQMTPEEQALAAQYSRASSAAQARGQTLLAAAGAPKSGPDSPGPRFVRLVNHHRPDSTDPWVLDEFPRLADAYGQRRHRDRSLWDSVESSRRSMASVALAALAVPVGGALLLVLIGILPILRFKVYPPSPGSPLPIGGFRAGHGRFDLTSFTGTMRSDAGVRSEEQVYGKVGPGNVVVPTHSVTTVYNQLRLTDGEGRQQSIEVADFRVLADKGHEMTVVWAGRPGRSGGDAIAVLNRTTGQAFFRSQSWGLFLGPGRMIGVGLLALLAGMPLALFSGGLGIALPFGVWFAMYVFTKSNIQTFRRRVAARA